MVDIKSVAKMKAETVICRLCLEPLYNFICVDCLLDAVKQWLRKNGASELIPSIKKRHDEIKTLLSSDSNSVLCIKCKQETNSWACPCCYLYEIYIIIKRNKPEIANRFERIFNFDFHYHHAFTQLMFWQSLHKQPLSTKNFKPVILSERESNPDLNICNRCGITSELKEVNGEWLCSICRDEI